MNFVFYSLVVLQNFGCLRQLVIWFHIYFLWDSMTCVVELPSIVWQNVIHTYSSIITDWKWIIYVSFLLFSIIVSVFLYVSDWDKFCLVFVWFTIVFNILFVKGIFFSCNTYHSCPIAFIIINRIFNWILKKIQGLQLKYSLFVFQVEIVLKSLIFLN